MSDDVTRHYDGEGNITGYSEKGSDGVTRHYDSSHERTGTTERGDDGVYRHYDAHGERTGTSERGDGGIIRHYDAHGERAGTSEHGSGGVIRHYDRNYERIPGKTEGRIFGTESPGRSSSGSYSYPDGEPSGGGGGSARSAGGGSSQVSSSSNGEDLEPWVVLVLIAICSFSIFLVVEWIKGVLRKSALKYGTTMEHELCMYVLAIVVGLLVTLLWTVGIPWYVSHKLKDEINLDIDELHIQIAVFIASFAVQIGLLCYGPTGVFLRKLFYHSIR